MARDELDLRAFILFAAKTGPWTTEQAFLWLWRTVQRERAEERRRAAWHRVNASLPDGEAFVRARDDAQSDLDAALRRRDERRQRHVFLDTRWRLRPKPTTRPMPALRRPTPSRPHARTPRRIRAVTRRAATRAGPGSRADDDPEQLTALQRAVAALLAAISYADADARTRSVFLDIAARRLAHEYARHLESA